MSYVGRLTITYHLRLVNKLTKKILPLRRSVIDSYQRRQQISFPANIETTNDGNQYNDPLSFYPIFYILQEIGYRQSKEEKLVKLHPHMMQYYDWISSKSRHQA